MDFEFFDHCLDMCSDDMVDCEISMYQTQDCHSLLKEVVTETETNSGPSLDELDFIAFWNKNLEHCYGQKVPDQTATSLTENCSGNFNELDEVLRHVPSLPSSIKRKGASYIMIATCLDATEIGEHLEKVLDKEQYQAFPLSFSNQGTNDVIRDICQEPALRTIAEENGQCRYLSDHPQRPLKRSHDGDEEQKENENENKATKMMSKFNRSKRPRMSWMNTDQKESEGEDKDLERQIKFLMHSNKQ